MTIRRRQLIAGLGRSNPPDDDYPAGATGPAIVAAAMATWSLTLPPGKVGQVLRQVPNDDEIGRSAMTKTLRKILPDVYPMCTRRPV